MSKYDPPWFDPATRAIKGCRHSIEFITQSVRGPDDWWRCMACDSNFARENAARLAHLDAPETQEALRSLMDEVFWLDMFRIARGGDSDGGISAIESDEGLAAYITTMLRGFDLSGLLLGEP